MGYDRSDSKSPEMQMGRRAREADLEDHPDLLLDPRGSPKPLMRTAGYKASEPLREQSPKAELHQRPTSPPREALASRARPTPASGSSHASAKSSGSQRRPFKVPSHIETEAAHDQENEPPPTFRKPQTAAPVLQPHAEMPKQDQIQRTASPDRKPLVSVVNNIPHRPAPAPPPKMSSLLDAATSNPANRKKGSQHVVINGRQYRRLDCIGRGGSSRIYRIMADNFKIFALKRVNLEEADAAAIAGYKGEIDLLNKLSHIDRVIRLFDYEVNDEKQILNVMMEVGETDFNKLLNEQCKVDDAKLDVTFTRHYWKEMLECVGAVHIEDVVHSDLKPANFLLVKGRLKLIDFGIANAIQDDTVNVYRENQIGTPNYMSPESLICNNVTQGEHGDIKEIKLGKPSDVWSLGCILYQMTYGQPPFAHIQSQMQRIMSIPNPKVEIQFPTRGIGGAVVPFGLIKTLRRCLTREQSLRPTIQELLADSDPFLNPVAISPDMLGRVIGNVVSYCRRREEGMRKTGELLPADGPSCLPKDEDMKGWPGAFYDKLKQAMEDGTAW
jgi:serine/threonine-protein kinase TTK/MPS1